MIRRFYDGVYWEMLPAVEALLPEILKGGPESCHRTPRKLVSSHRLERRLFFVKRYLHGTSLWRPAKFFFKPPRSRMEWRRAPELIQLGVPVVEHVAHGEQWSLRGLLQSILVTEAPAGYLPVSAQPDREHPALQAAVGRLLSVMHRCGLRHGDLHPDNLLFSVEKAHCCLVDLDRIEPGANLGTEERLRAIASIASFIPLGPEFYRSYGEPSLQDSRQLAQLVHHRRRLIAIEEVKRRVPPRHHSNFHHVELGGLRWWVRDEMLTDSLKEVLQDADEILQVHSVKTTRSVTVAMAGEFVLKQYKAGMVLKRIRRSLKSSRARSSFRKECHLEILGIKTAAAAAFADVRRAGVLQHSCLVTCRIPEAAELSLWNGKRRGAINSLARLLARVHDEGFSHRDLKEQNIMLDAKGEAYLIDLDGLSFKGEVTRRRAVADLRRLSLSAVRLPFRVSFTDRLRFLFIYCKARGFLDWRRWVNYF